MVIYIILMLIIITADRLTKIYVESAALGESIGKIPHIADFIYVRNTGAAFSMFSGKVSALGAVSVIFCIGLIIYWVVKRPVKPLLCTALTMIFAGAAGNAIDRIMNGYVVDFINLVFIDFPVFNIADISITAGAALLIIYYLIFDKDKNNERADNKS